MRVEDDLVGTDRPVITTDPAKQQVNETQVINITLISDQQKRIVQKFQCLGCKRNFGNVSGLSRHGPHCSNTSNAGKSLSTCSIRFECSKCRKTFASKGYLKQHQSSSVLCRRMAEESILLALSETNSTVRNLVCVGCEKEFLNKNGLQSHKNHCKVLKAKSMVGSDTNRSQVPGESISTESSRSEPIEEPRKESAPSSNISEQSSKSINPLQCLNCNRIFKNKSGLTSHKNHCAPKPQSDGQAISARPDLEASASSPNKEGAGQKDMSLTLVDTANQNIFSKQTVQTNPNVLTSPETEQQSQTAEASNSSKANETEVANQSANYSSTALTKQTAETSQSSNMNQRPTNKNQPIQTLLKCTLCPKVCKNKGSLASHFKACTIRNNPALQKSQRRLSKSLLLVTRQSEDERDRRLSTTLIVKQV